MVISGSLQGDTIAAIATAPGRGGVGIVRISGPASLAIAETICATKLVKRYAHFCTFSDRTGVTLDSGIALYFPNPHSFTGEDVTELQAHGGPIVLDMLLKACCSLGARPAKPGEFSERAYLNGKIDLSQAEAIADLINSTTEQAALNANRSLQGAFSKKIDDLVRMVIELRVYVEAAIDFPEEEIDFIGDGIVKNKLLSLMDQLSEVEQQAKQGSLIREGMKVVIAGKPNAGKSSLLNAMSGQERAIVTSIAGTTRDILHEHISIDGMPLHIVDTAGIRDSSDEIELEGIRRTHIEIESADRILLIIDDSSNQGESDSLVNQLSAATSEKPIPTTIIFNKCDISGKAPGLNTKGPQPIVYLSAKTGTGLNLLSQHLKEVMGFQSGSEGQFSARRRHLESITQAGAFLTAGLKQLEATAAGELLAEDLRQCQNCLGAITGSMSSDELLGKIFSNFCIGK